MKTPDYNLDPPDELEFDDEEEELAAMQRAEEDKIDAAEYYGSMREWA